MKYLQEAPDAWEVYKHAVFLMGPLMLTQSLWKNLKEDQTRESEPVHVKKWWLDSFVDMPAPVVELMHRG